MNARNVAKSGSDQQGAGSSVGGGAAACSDHVGDTTVKEEIWEWTRVFHNHSAIYTKYKNVCTKTTSTLQRQHVQHMRGSVTGAYVFSLLVLFSCFNS